MTGGDADDSDPGGPSFSDGETESAGDLRLAHISVRRFRLLAVDGPQKGVLWESSSDRCSVGSDPSNEWSLADPTISRFHCDIRMGGQGAWLRDLGSRNGTTVDGVRVMDAFLRDGSLIRLGRTTLQFQMGTQENRLPLSESTTFGSLVGVSPAMRGAFALLERAAECDATVLLEGETGTGKEGAAAAIHHQSARHDGPFVVVDCGAIPAHLIESELYGHELGAFTGATHRRIGAFEEAHRGTLFLDEVSELPLDLQPKFLRVLEKRELRRIGGSGAIEVDIRVIAATHRDLRAQVNAGEFRSDLFYRLAVLRIALPPLRKRPEDLPVLVAAILATLGAAQGAHQELSTPEFIASLRRAAWPGNVRELRNYLECCLVTRSAAPLDDAPAREGTELIDVGVSYEEARLRALAHFERRYVELLLSAHGGKVAQASRAAAIDRGYLYRLMKRHGL